MNQNGVISRKCIKCTLKSNEMRRIRNRKYVYEYLLVHPCVDCGETDPVVLTFDHICDKKMNVSKMIRQGRSFEKLKEEIEKCEVRCANCHARKTAKEQGWYKNNGLG